MDNPTKPEAAQQHSGQADVSQGFNSNLSSADVAETQAAKEIEAAHQHSGSQSSDPAQQMDESGMLSPQGQQPQEDAGSTRMGQSGDQRNREVDER